MLRSPNNGPTSNINGYPVPPSSSSYITISPTSDKLSYKRSHDSVELTRQSEESHTLSPSDSKRPRINGHSLPEPVTRNGHDLASSSSPVHTNTRQCWLALSISTNSQSYIGRIDGISVAFGQGLELKDKFDVKIPAEVESEGVRQNGDSSNLKLSPNRVSTLTQAIDQLNTWLDDQLMPCKDVSTIDYPSVLCITNGHDVLRNLLYPQAVRQGIDQFLTDKNDSPHLTWSRHYVDVLDWASSILQRDGSTVALRSIDQIVEDHHFPQPNVIKSGYEHKIYSRDAVISENNVLEIRQTPWSATPFAISAFFAGLNVLPGGVAFRLTDGRRSNTALVAFESPQDALAGLNRHQQLFSDALVFEGLGSHSFNSSTTTTQSYIESSGGVSSQVLNKPVSLQVHPSSGSEFILAVGCDQPPVVAFLNQLTKGVQVVVRVRGLLYTITKAEIMQFFEQASAPILNGVDGIFLVCHPDGRATGDAFVLFDDEVIAMRALGRHKQDLRGRYAELFKSSPSEMIQVCRNVVCHFQVSKGSSLLNGHTNKVYSNKKGVIPQISNAFFDKQRDLPLLMSSTFTPTITPEHNNLFNNLLMQVAAPTQHTLPPSFIPSSLTTTTTASNKQGHLYAQLQPSSGSELIFNSSPSPMPHLGQPSGTSFGSLPGIGSASSVNTFLPHLFSSSPSSISLVQQQSPIIDPDLLLSRLIGLTGGQSVANNGLLLQANNSVPSSTTQSMLVNLNPDLKTASMLLNLQHQQQQNPSQIEQQVQSPIPLASMTPFAPSSTSAGNFANPSYLIQQHFTQTPSQPECAYNFGNLVNDNALTSMLLPSLLVERGLQPVSQQPSLIDHQQLLALTGQTARDKLSTAVVLTGAPFDASNSELMSVFTKVQSSLTSDVSQSFLRAARAGNLQKIQELFANNTIDIHASNVNGLNALHLAAKEGHVAVVTHLLQRGVDTNKATKKGNTALHIASLAGQFEVVKLLLDASAQVDLQAQNGFTPLYMAAQENHLEVVKLLLVRGANPNLPTDDGFTPLAVALQQGHDRIVALLLESDARGKICLPALHIAAKKDDVKAANLLLNSDVNVDHQSASGFTPLHITAHYGNLNMMNLLIARGANINFQAKNNITPLHVACKWGNLGAAERLLQAGAELDCRTRDGLTPLHCAARSGHDSIVQLLLGHGADYRAKTRSGLNSLHMAAQGDHVDSARHLLQKGALIDDPTIDSLTALHVAAHCGNEKVIRLLLDRGADVNARALNGFTPMHIACQKNRNKVVEMLLKHGCLIDSTTESGLSPLHVASFMGHLSIVVLLLQHGSSPNACTMNGESALHLAARANQLDVARLLLRNGAQVDLKVRQTALHVAARTGHTDMVALLLEHSADPQALTKDTYTPLHLAAKGNHVDVCRLLLNTNAVDVDATTKSGFTPLHLAIKQGNIDVINLLLAARADVNCVGRNGLTPLHLAVHYGSVPIAQLLLQSGTKNGFTPLHIASERGLTDVARLLLQLQNDNQSLVEVESRNGFTPLHLAAQSGSAELTSLLLDAGSNPDAKAKNGLTPMHLAAQEDSLKAAEVLATVGCQLDSKTKSGYTPLHTACHFGQASMVRFLISQGVDLNAQTHMGSNALHLAAQQGHAKVVYILLECGCSPNMTNMNGWTPAHVARRQHYLNIFEVLKQVTTCVESWEVEYEVESNGYSVDSTSGRHGLSDSRLMLEQPDVMADHAVTDTEEECVEPDYTDVPVSPVFVVEQRQSECFQHPPSSASANRRSRGNLSEDSIHEAVNVEVSHQQAAGMNGFANQVPGWPMSAQDLSDLTAISSTTDWDFAPDNIPLSRKPVTSGFLVSFLVDARGGSMRGSRHAGLHVMVPPNAASAPTRLTCRMLRPERTTRPPQLNDGEGLACRIVELGPHPRTFNSPVLFELPHFASLCGRERELVILRSDNAETWVEHSREATDQAVQSAVGGNFDSLETSEELKRKRILRILTNEFPQYLAVVSRLRQETAIIGSDGGVLSSSVIPQVQAVFPEGALQKRIRVGLQAHPIPADTVKRVMGNRVAVSPIVTLEPRRRKFHKPITLTIPLPRAPSSGHHHHRGLAKSQDAPSLRLLCSIAGGTLPAHWEDITGSTPLSKVKDCVSFTTIVSARFWLVDCPLMNELVNMTGQLYNEANLVPYMGKFVVFAKRLENDEALIRCFCTTDDKIDKTLECQEEFELVAASPEVEVLDGRPIHVEVGGNLQPVTKMGQPLGLHFYAFYENRLAFPVKIKDLNADPVGKIAFFREWNAAAGPDDLDANKPTCVLEVSLSGNSQLPAQLTLSEQRQVMTSAGSDGSLTCVFPHGVNDNGDAGDMNGGDRHGEADDETGRIWMSNYASGLVARGQLDLVKVADEVGSDWPALGGALLPESGLSSRSSIDQLLAWISSREAEWEAMRDDAVSGGGGLGGLTSGELRSERDKALALLLAWREQRREAATGNELERALRSIGRMDVVKSCMLEIAYVTDPNEYVEASRLIDQSQRKQSKASAGDEHEHDHQPTEVDYDATATSIVDSTVLASAAGVDDGQKSASIPPAADAHLEMDVDPSSTSMIESESVIAPVASIGQETLPSSSEILEDDDSHHPRQSSLDREEEEEECDEDVIADQSTSPVISTSSPFGDPMLKHEGVDEDFDMIREGESMTLSGDEEESAVVEEEKEETCEEVIVEQERHEQVESQYPTESDVVDSSSTDQQGSTGQQSVSDPMKEEGTTDDQQTSFEAPTSLNTGADEVDKIDRTDESVSELVAGLEEGGGEEPTDSAHQPEEEEVDAPNLSAAEVDHQQEHETGAVDGESAGGEPLDELHDLDQPAEIVHDETGIVRTEEHVDEEGVHDAHHGVIRNADDAGDNTS